MDKMESKRISNNPNGRPKKRGETSMVSYRLPDLLMTNVKSKTDNVTEFIILALEEKLKSLE